MTIYKLEAANDATTIIGSSRRVALPNQGLRIILGVGYTDNEALAGWAAGRGYKTSEVEAVPPEYTQQVARLDAYPVEFAHPSIDGNDPDSRYRVTAADGRTTIDIRDVIYGVITA